MARKASWKKECLGNGPTKELDAHWVDRGEDIPDREISKYESSVGLWKRFSGGKRKWGWKGGMQKAKMNEDELLQASFKKMFTSSSVI